MSRRFTGGCHCRALHFRLDWPEDAGPLPARRCTCSYCTRFDGTWTSHPDARLELIESGETEPSGDTLADLRKKLASAANEEEEKSPFLTLGKFLKGAK